MIILFGTHHFARRKTAVRKDFCNACERECVAEQWQSFDCGHLFFIPVLPLGTRQRWHCSLCGKDPRARYKTRNSLRIVGLVVLPPFVLPIFFAPDDKPAKPKKPEEAYAPYVVAAAFGAAWLYLLYATFRRDSDPPEDERRKAIVPLSTESCFYCKGPLKRDPDYHCEPCGIRIYGGSRSLPPSLPLA